MNKLTGLHNLGNTCYLNSAMQLIINCTVLSKVIILSEFNQETEGIHGRIQNGDSKHFVFTTKKNLQ